MTGLRPKIGLGLARCGLRLSLGHAGLVLCCETRSRYARRHNDLEGYSNCSSIISVLSCEHVRNIMNACKENTVDLHLLIVTQQVQRYSQSAVLILVLVLLFWSWS